MRAAKEHEEYRRGGGIHHKGHVEHEHHGIVHHKHHKKGGEVDGEKKHEKRARGGKVGSADVAHIERQHRKIHVPDRKRELKRGGKVEGEETRHRVDRRARGGRMTPHSPLSGADVKPLPYYASVKQTGGTKGAGGERHHRD
ncbi:MAG TPA: hypothetical protein VFA22_07235 [Stellaceae bacterium]|nr:hypothetical protein [Stellaceae bacterium]